MKSQRQELIMKLVRDEVIETQEDLKAALEKHGVKITQATLSRDIKQLALIKVTDDRGISRYCVSRLNKQELMKDNSSAFSLISSSVISVDYAVSTVVIKCHTGMAQAVCAKLDNTAIENLVGTIAGDDTIFMLMRTPKDADRLVRELNSIISGT